MAARAGRSCHRGARGRRRQPRQCSPVRLSRPGWSIQFGRASAPSTPQPVHTIRGPKNSAPSRHRASARGPASVIRTRVTSIARPAANVCSALAVASPQRTKTRVALGRSATPPKIKEPRPEEGAEALCTQAGLVRAYSMATWLSKTEDADMRQIPRPLEARLTGSTTDRGRRRDHLVLAPPRLFGV